MTAVEEIQAAIERLVALRSGSEIGSLDYDIEDGTLYSELDIEDSVFLFRAHEDSIIPKSGKPDGELLVLAELLATLHCTIDAQLALLSLALEYGMLAEGSGSRFTRTALTLARAINGTRA